MKVFIYSVPRPSAYNIHLWNSSTSNKPLNKTKVGKCSTGIRALFDPSKGGLANFISYTPWIEDGKPVLDETSSRPLTLQDKYERKFNLPKGYLSNKSWRPGDSQKEEDLTYFQKKTFYFNDGSTVLDTDNFDDLMAYYVCLASKYVANSEKEWRQHKFPKAQFYIALENESEQIKYTRNFRKTKAISTLHSPEFTPSLQQKFVHVLNLAATNIPLTIEQTYNLLLSFLEHPNDLNLTRYEELFDLTRTPEGREELECRHILKRGVDRRLIVEKQDTYTMMRAKGAITMGETYREAVDFLKNPKKSAQVEELLNALNNVALS